MFLEGDQYPFVLADRTIALTYDDGPGPRSVELAQFLRDNGIRAAFFLVGRHVRKLPQAARKALELGHLIGNHTMTHPSLPRLLGTPQLDSEVLETHRLIEETVGCAPRHFRAPFGAWDAGIAQRLNGLPELRDYSGPVKWDIQYGDCWIGGTRPGEAGTYTLERCRENYLGGIEKAGRGVVLMHDWAADEGEGGDRLRAKNRVLELTTWLVPRLREKGFRFVRLDETEALAR